MIDPNISPHRVRQIILQQSKRANVGHIGSALSIVDILCALYGHVLNIPKLKDPCRDRFILSKGHAALALYAVLNLKGWISAEELNSYCGDHTHLGVHPEHTVPGIDFSTGSLGQGLSFGTGAALAARMNQQSYRSFVLLSDAELNEGSVWEAVMFAAHHKISNLVAIIDDNAQQAFGYTKDVIDLRPLADKWRAFGWDVHEVDGHNIKILVKTMNGLNTESGPPHVIIAKTTFGKGVSFMENKIKWHYWPMSEEDYKTALTDIAQVPA